MLCKTVIFLTFTVICVSSECGQECRQYGSRQYTRVKRGKYYSNPPIRFYNQPPMVIPIKGPFSYTPPPFMADSRPPYPGSRPYKVSKRPTVPSNEPGLGDDDISNLVKHLSKQDLNKILEFAQEKDQDSNKYKDIYRTNEYARPYKRESNFIYKGNVPTKYEDPAPYIDESTVSNSIKERKLKYVLAAQEDSKPIRINSLVTQKIPYENGNYNIQKVPIDYGNYVSNQDYTTSLEAENFPTPQTNDNNGYEPMYIKGYTAQVPSIIQADIDNEKYTSNQMMPINVKSVSPSQNYENPQEEVSYPTSNNPSYSEFNEEDQLPQPENMRLEDYEVSYTNNVQKVVQADSSSYNIENFGDLPLMDYHSKLHDVSSYHVPHYTVTQPKPSRPSAPRPVSFQSSPLSTSYSSPLSLLKPSPAAAAIKEPIYERAPPASVAAEESDGHLKAIKIWSHKSKGAAYTLHDDGSLTPERSRPKYG